METKRNVKYFIAPPISIMTIIGLVITAVAAIIFFVADKEVSMYAILGIIVGLLFLIFTSGGKSNDTDIEYQARELTKDLQEASMKKFEVYDQSFLKQLKPIDIAGYDFEAKEDVKYFKKGADGTPRTNYFAAYNMIFTGEKMYVCGKRLSLTDESINEDFMASYKYTELEKAELEKKVYKSDKGEEFDYYVFRIYGINGNKIIDTCIDYGADSDKAVDDINRTIAVRCVELKKRDEEKAEKLRAFREKVLSSTPDPLDEEESFN